jgi:hypothetical protein
MLRFGRLVGAFAAPALLLTACSEINAPGPLQVSVAVHPNTLAPGDTVQIALTVRNISSQPVTFNVVCAIDVRVLPVGDTTDVTKPGPRICIMIYAPVTLAPSEALEQTYPFNALRWTCDAGSCGYAPFPPGSYRVTGVVFYERGPGVSPPIPLEIR